MANQTAEIDKNNKPTLTAVTDDSNQYITKLLVDPATGRLLVSATISGGAVVAGLDTQVQFNQTGNLGASSNFRFDYTNQVLMIGDGTPTYTVGSNNILSVTKNVAGYLGVDIQNLSTDTIASADLFITNNAGTDDSNYLDLGIQSTTNTDPLYTAFQAGDTYIISQSTNLNIGTATTGKTIRFFSGGTLAANLRATISDTAFNLNYLTASQILGTDASKNLVSLPVATYPSLTELSYVKGVTSGIQAQINAKGAGTVTAVSVATANGVSGSSSGGATPALTITLGAITPTSVNGVTISGSATPTLAVTGTSSISGSNTGDNATNSTYTTLATTIATANTWSAAQTFTKVIQTVTAMGAQALDGTLGNIFTRTLGTSETFTQSGFSVGQCFIVKVKQGSGTSYTVTWFATVTWITSGGTAPVQTTTTNGYTTYGFVCTGSNTFDGYLVSTQ